MHLHNGEVLYYDTGKLNVGGVMRYTVTGNDLTNSLHCCLRNTELSALRAAYLKGPYTLYVDMRPEDYSEFENTPNSAKPVYNYHLKAGQHFTFDLPVMHPQQTWIITVQSEILFSRSAVINYTITIGTNEHVAKLHGSNIKKHFSINSNLSVLKHDTALIWQTPLPRPNEPLHICVLTHGLVSNVTADMLYMKETIDAAAAITGENLICKGYTGNVCRTERGVKYLGHRLANWITDELIPTYKPSKLSFVAHSLGGLTQIYALGYIQATNPDILKDIELVNFIALASPILGISTENPGYVQFALDFGIVGKSGRDLALSWTPGKKHPLLESLPNEDTLTILGRFQNRTLYANAVNDGIVPLRTAALVFLDWYAIAKANEAFKAGKHHLIHRKKGVKHSKDFENEKENESQDPEARAHGQTKDTAKVKSKKNDPLKSLFNHRQTLVSHYQTVGDIGETSGTVGETLPHKTSLIESGISILLPPHPTQDFITDPSSRQDVIFHDRLYTEKDLPPRHYKTSLVSSLNGKDEKVEVSKMEERIARSYHTKLSWRKVLVNLLPEAHNNIIVRRRFSNAYGWPVVHHLVEEHFLPNRLTLDTSSDSSVDITEQTSNLNIDDGSVKSSQSVVTKSGTPWSDSDDEKELDTDHDPQRSSMLKLIRDT